MNCYFCDFSAHGQCLECGRFICREDSWIYNGKPKCLNCYSVCVNLSLYDSVRSILKNAEAGKCEICKKNLSDVNFKIFDCCIRAGLNPEEVENLKKEFSPIYRCNKNNCLTCQDHTPPIETMYDRYDHTYYGRKCMVCGKMNHYPGKDLHRGKFKKIFDVKF